ncbi:threonine/serine exporter family protein [Puniceicoccus vermicola]|nr:threonine/serine exporter family protein [Puniceicoccus vermicola]
MNMIEFSESDQHRVTELCVQTAIVLMQFSAESVLVESVSRRLGVALGMDQVEVALTANGITITTVFQGRSDTTVRRNVDRGINMRAVTEVQRIMLKAEEGLLDVDGVSRELEGISQDRYNRWVVAVMIGLSCACFARLAGADIPASGLTFVASFVAMTTRHQLAHLHFNPLVNFAIAAFVATSIAAQGLILGFVGTPKIAMAASVLLLVPGFPLINSVSDMVKGYVNTGIARGVMAGLLCAASCAGILLAMTVWDAWAWIK